MSVFVHNGVACLLKDIVNVGVVEKDGVYICAMTHLTGKDVVITTWGHKEQDDATKHFQEIVKLLEEKGWGKE